MTMVIQKDGFIDPEALVEVEMDAVVDAWEDHSERRVSFLLFSTLEFWVWLKELNAWLATQKAYDRIFYETWSWYPHIEWITSKINTMTRLRLGQAVFVEPQSHIAVITRSQICLSNSTTKTAQDLTFFHYGSPSPIKRSLRSHSFRACSGSVACGLGNLPAAYWQLSKNTPFGAKCTSVRWTASFLIRVVELTVQRRVECCNKTRRSTLIKVLPKRSRCLNGFPSLGVEISW